MSTKGLTLDNADSNNRLALGRQHSSPINTLYPRYGKGVTPLFNTFESMEIEFDIDDLSEEDEDEVDGMQDMVMLCNYDSYDTWDSRDGDEIDNDQQIETLQIIQETKQDNNLYNDSKSKINKKSANITTTSSSTINDRTIKPSKIKSLTKKRSNKLKKKNSNKKKKDLSMEKGVVSELPPQLNVENDFLKTKPKFGASASVPIKQMKHYQVDALTIWSNHQRDLEDLYQKWTVKKSNVDAKKNKNKPRKGNKNIKFKDMEDMKDNNNNNNNNDNNDPYIDDMKTQLKHYGSNSVDIIDNKTDDESEEEQVRKYLIGEIIETEGSYVKGLQTLMYEFIIPIFDQKLIKRKYKEIITCNIPEILVFHRTFLEQLIEATSPVDFGDIDQDKNRSLASVFNELCNNEFVEMYTNYTKQYHRILDVFAKYNKSKKLQKYLKNKRKEKKPLTNHLILPIQRVTRYLLLLQELKKNTTSTHNDYNELEAVLSKIVKTVNMINERQREIENMSQCLQVQETMTGLNRNIVESHRKLLSQLLFRKKENQRGRQFFLFNDILIITNLKLKVKTIIEMRTIDAKRITNKNNLQFELYSLHHQGIYETDPDKIDDLNDLLMIIEDNRSIIHQESLQSVGADDIAKLLKGSRSVSQGQMFRDQISLKSQSSIDSNISLTSATSNHSVNIDDLLYD